MADNAASLDSPQHYPPTASTSSRHGSKRIHRVQGVGPEPTLLSRREVDALYDALEAVVQAFAVCQLDYIITGGTLLGAVRQHSILFCDDDVDVAVLLHNDNHSIEQVQATLQRYFDENQTAVPLQYQVRPWEGGDRVRPNRTNTVFVDIFGLRRYESLQHLAREVLGKKTNGQVQPRAYVDSILQTISRALHNADSESGATESSSPQQQPASFWHFDTRKAVELWPKEVYREWELFPLQSTYKLGPLTQVCGPRMPVRLLKRAFGPDCFEVYYQSVSHGKSASKHPKPSVIVSGDHPAGAEQTTMTTQPEPSGGTASSKLPPKTLAGGLWDGSPKKSLQEEHYLPMQPTLRAKRRLTGHNKAQLQDYLAEQVALEGAWVIAAEAQYEWAKQQAKESSPTKPPDHRPRCTVYMDGVFDLFHIGHLKALQQCAALGDVVVIGVTGDDDAEGYKRRPIVPQDERVAMVRALSSLVNKVICPCPLQVTQTFMETHGIDLVVHGFCNAADAALQEREFFAVPLALGKFRRIAYHEGLSTTQRLRLIQERTALSPATNRTPSGEHKTPPPPPQWFGTAVTAAIDNAPTLPYDPVPLALRTVMEPHLAKARAKRTQALRNSDFLPAAPPEVDMSFDIGQFDLRAALLECVGLVEAFDLSQLHTAAADHSSKDELFHRLTQNFAPFQQVYDEFVRRACIPAMQRQEDNNNDHHEEDHFYYQAFPCVRVVQPGEFSIGPHADVSYGHHPATVNFYVPLTSISTANTCSTLFLESRPGSEDWHPIVGNYGFAKRFAGAQCLHWTVDNTTSQTRVSLDFRVIPGSQVRGAASAAPEYLDNPGYFVICRRNDDMVTWVRDYDDGAPQLPRPDCRMGFPWTVKNWDKFWDKKKIIGTSEHEQVLKIA